MRMRSKVQRIKMENKIYLLPKLIYRLDDKEKPNSICPESPSKTEVRNKAK